MLDIDDFIPELPIDSLNGLREQLDNYDAAHLLAAIGGLQLLPENAGASLRLEVLAHLALNVQPGEGRPSISSAELVTVCSETPLGEGLFLEMEDPFNNPFTESFAFFGGSYTVFPGTADEVTFVLRVLARAIFLGTRPFPNRAFVAEAQALLHAVLVLSDAIASRAGLSRGAEPSTDAGQPVVVPACAELEVLSGAVRLTEGELRRLLGEHGIELQALRRLVMPLGSGRGAAYTRGHGPLLARPIVRAGTQYIVALPASLLGAARDALIQAAQEHGVAQELASRVNIAIWATVTESLDAMGNVQAEGDLPTRPAFPSARDGVFMLDLDKALYVLLVADPVLGYDPEHPHNHWEDDWLARAESRVAEVERYLLTLQTPPNEVLSVVVAQGLQRLNVSGPPGPDATSAPLMLSLSAADLQLLGNLESGKPLVLWDYAQADRAVRRKTAIFSVGGELEKFQLYRSNGYSFYDNDDERASALNILPGRAGELRRELVRTKDIHAAPSFMPGRYIEVSRVYGMREAPIYLPPVTLSATLPLGFRYASLVEGLPLPVWVLGPTYETEEQRALHERYMDIVNAVAYWLWQFSPFLFAPLDAVAVEHSTIRIELWLEPHEVWHRPQALEELAADELVLEEEQFAFRIRCDPESGHISLTILPTFVGLVNAEDNRGERALMRSLLSAIRDLLPPTAKALLSESKVTDAIDKYAPLGLKRMLLVAIRNLAPEMDPRGLPSFLPVPRADEELLLDELGEYLMSTEHLPVGPVSPERRVELLGLAVHFFYTRLQALVTSLSPDGVLDFLVAQHEAIVHDAAEHRLTMPTRVACFARDTGVLAKIVQEMQELAKAGIASRFVIEYVATCPPRGRRPFSYSVYNRLLALASQIISYGSIRDMLHNELADIQLEILPSGRLEVDRAEYERASRSYLALFVTGELERLTRAFGHYWHDSEGGGDKEGGDDEGSDPELDSASRAEFGYTFTELLGFVMAAVTLAEERSPAGPAYAAMQLDDFVQSLSKRLGWEPRRVASMVTGLTLYPRADFLAPDAPFKRSDVYPWRFNRKLSYLRRPFLYRERGGSVELVWGRRHLHNAWEYVLHLCQSGRLQARSEEMRTLLGRINREVGREFNNEVASLFRQVPSLLVRTRVGKGAGIRYPEEQLGDIDVLVADPEKRVLRLVECKDLAIARTPHEMALERKALFEGTRKRLSTLEKQEARAAWVRENLAAVLAWLGIDSIGEWRVEPIIVVDVELMTPHLAQPSVQVLSVEQLRKGSSQNDLLS